MRQESAQIVALNAISWLAGEDELLGVFLGASGASLGDLRAGAEDAAVQAAVLDFLLMDDAWLLGFCGAARLTPESVRAARAVLPGGDAPHWT